MYALFEDSGKLGTGRILSQAQSSSQIELESGKRIKVKDPAILFKFETPKPEELLTSAKEICDSIDLQIAWEFAPTEEFSFLDLSVEYFSASPSSAEQVAMLKTLHDAPHYFRRMGKGRFKKASAEVIQQALIAIERKKELLSQIGAWADELALGKCPQPVSDEIYKILFKPDKNSAAYKAVVQAAKQAQMPAMALLTKAGAIASAYEFHWQRFLFDQFPKGFEFQSNTAAPTAAELDKITAPLPLASAVAFSIDDSQTTEIDDALSVQGLGTTEVTVGIHIAAPALWIKTNDSVDTLARSRLSTVYMPGVKITMLPKSVIEHFTLREGAVCPALSLYVVLNADTFEILNTYTRIERVKIEKNLRHDRLDHIVTVDWLNHEDSPASPDLPELPDSSGEQDNGELGSSESPHLLGIHHLSDLPRTQLSYLFRLAQHLKAQREVVRGKPENFNRPDFNFQIEKIQNTPLTGSEIVRLEPRHRGAPLDLIVAEAMILANSTWGKWMADLGVPGIYRSQASMAAGIKVRMSTKALPHAGIGVPCYAWSTSPLRRYTDLVNQWQICACVQHGATAALVAPFKPKDTDLMAIISAFDCAYTAYNSYQSSMERYWTLKYVQQENIHELTLNVFKTYPGTPPLARADTLPLVLSVNGAPDLQRGAQIRVRLSSIDLMSMDVKADFLELCHPSSNTSLESTQIPEFEEDPEDSAQAQDAASVGLSGLSLELDLDVRENDPDHGPQSGATYNADGEQETVVSEVDSHSKHSDPQSPEKPQSQ